MGDAKKGPLDAILGGLDPKSWVTSALGEGLKGLIGGADQIIKDFVPDPNKQMEVTIRLKEIENAAATLVMQAEQNRLADVQSARTMRGGSAKLAQDVLALVFTACFFGLLAFILFWMRGTNLDATQQNIVFLIFGAVSGIEVTIIGFYFGSSKSSSDKNDVIGGALQQIATSRGKE